MSSPESAPSSPDGKIEKKTVTHWGEAVGETEKRYDESGRIVFEKAVDLATGAVNTAEYRYENGVLKEEIWKDKEGRVARYVYTERGERMLAEKSPGFEDIDF